MTDVDGGGLLFDQSGQQVESQYNADSIMVVGQILDATTGKCCPRCNASPMRRTQIVWEQNTRRARHGTVVLNRLAQRVAPPQYPDLVPRRFAGGRYLSLLAAPAGLAVLWLCCTSPLVDTARKQEAGLMPTSAQQFTVAQVISVRTWGWLVLAVVAIAAAAWTGFRYWSHRGKVKTALVELARLQAAYQRRRERWRRSWFCDACGAMAVEAEVASASAPTV